MEGPPRRFAVSLGLLAALLAVATASVAFARPSLAQPTFLMPWPHTEAWQFSGGPHGPGFSGIDFAPPLGAKSRPVLAVAGGTVTFVGYDSYGFGWKAVIDHGGGWETWYAHLAAAPALTQGQRVPQGQYIGEAGMSGNATGIHVHLELRKDGQRVNWDGLVIDGWTVHSTGTAYYGYLEKDGQRINVEGPGVPSSNVRRNGCPEPTPTPTAAAGTTLQNAAHRSYGAGVTGGAAEDAAPGC